MAHQSAERRPIAVLPAALAQRIAAGEVIDRPAAVLRELVENALDAGASTVRVEVRGAGLDLIAVSDDGHGIVAEEVRLAFARYGTSKLSSPDDLDHVYTLGFRGEALPSIAAVATVEVVTAVEHEAIAARLLLEAGEVVEEGRTARTRGTTVRVRDLFAGQPVRRGFLPSPRAENALLLALVRRYALAWPQIRFELRLDGRPAFRSAGLGEAGALAAVFGAGSGRMRPLGTFTAGQAEFHGYLGDPGLTRADREGLIVVVNRRWVSPQRWLASLERAYRPLLPSGRHPVAVLYAAIDPTFVDVNLHPAKLELRMRDEEQVLQVLSTTIRDRLGHTVPDAALVRVSATRPRQHRLPSARRSLREPETAYTEHAPDFERMRLLGQLFDTMIVGESNGVLYLIDQHRADERALYESLVAEHAGAASQELLEPLRLELRPDAVKGAEAALADMERAGFRCERFGSRTFLVRAVPLGLPVSTGSALLAALDDGVEDAPDWRDRLLIAVACRAAVKRGHGLGEHEMHDLVKRLHRCAIHTLCPHGSPLVAEVRAADLSRHFGWR